MTAAVVFCIVVVTVFVEYVAANNATTLQAALITGGCSACSIPNCVDGLVPILNSSFTSTVFCSGGLVMNLYIFIYRLFPL